jgi:hypothetical protein
MSGEQGKQPGLDGRHRDIDGEIHRKRSDTLIRTLRGEYPGFATDVRGDMKLGNYLDRKGYAFTLYVQAVPRWIVSQGVVYNPAGPLERGRPSWLLAKVVFAEQSSRKGDHDGQSQYRTRGAR